MAKVLVVDDEEGIRDFLVEVLVRDGHEVSEAPDGHSALEYLAKQQVEVLLTDVRMPGMGGIELLHEAKRRDPSLEVVVLTAHASVDTAVDAMKAGAVDFLTKPVKQPAEIRKVIRMAARHRAMHTRVQALAPPEGPVLTYGAPAMEPVLHDLEKVAPTRATVLLTGESGTGKEVVAREIHRLSARPGAFVAVNCAALSAHLLESELFGHERGAFTGAVAMQRGKIELAEGGTFFLDEIGELEPGLQAKLLRVLQERTYERVGGQKTLTADVRWVAATNRSLRAMVDDGAFREDLYYRLNVFPLHLPPLRERPEDIGPLALALLRQLHRELGRRFDLTDDAIETLRTRPWRGNVRELRNVLERACIVADGPRIEAVDLGVPSGRLSPSAPVVSTMEQAERRAIEAALAHHGGNRRLAAETLGIGVRTLYDKLKRYDLG
jgi:two-component system response regulator FlrC